MSAIKQKSIFVLHLPFSSFCLGKHLVSVSLVWFHVSTEKTVWMKNTGLDKAVFAPQIPFLASHLRHQQVHKKYFDTTKKEAEKLLLDGKCLAHSTDDSSGKLLSEYGDNYSYYVSLKADTLHPQNIFLPVLLESLIHYLLHMLISWLTHSDLYGRAPLFCFLSACWDFIPS